MMDIKEIKEKEDIRERDLNNGDKGKEHVRVSLHALLEYCYN